MTGDIQGQGSVTHGIQEGQDQQISVTKRSINVIKEYRNYLWKEDKNFTMLNVAEDLFNHSMDAIRYGLSSYKPRNNQSFNTNNKTNFK